MVLSIPGQMLPEPQLGYWYHQWKNAGLGADWSASAASRTLGRQSPQSEYNTISAGYGTDTHLHYKNSEAWFWNWLYLCNRLHELKPKWLLFKLIYHRMNHALSNLFPELKNPSITASTVSHEPVGSVRTGYLPEWRRKGGLRAKQRLPTKTRKGNMTFIDYLNYQAVSYLTILWS